MSVPTFWSQPIRYMRYAAHVYPARYYSLVIGFAGPVFLLAIPVRQRLGYENHPTIPTTWPSTPTTLPTPPTSANGLYVVPNRKRESVPSTYDDPQ
jgi:hypothetical protein